MLECCTCTHTTRSLSYSSKLFQQLDVNEILPFESNHDIVLETIAIAPPQLESNLDCTKLTASSLQRHKRWKGLSLKTTTLRRRYLPQLSVHGWKLHMGKQNCSFEPTGIRGYPEAGWLALNRRWLALKRRWPTLNHKWLALNRRWPTLICEWPAQQPPLHCLANLVHPSSQPRWVARVVCASVCPSHPFVTSNKVRVRPIRVNILLTLDRVNLDLLCPWWLPHPYHITATLDSRGCCGLIRLAEGCICWRRGANVCAPPPPRPFVPPPQPFVPPRERSHPPLYRARPLYILEMLAWKSTSPSNVPCQPTVLMRGKM
jgi:hypothetical protein